MREITEFDKHLSSINKKILSNNEKERSEAIQEFNNLINSELIKKYIIEDNNKYLLKINIGNKDIKDYITKKIKEENENLDGKNQREIIIQKIFNSSVENNFIGIFKHIMKNHRQEININEKVGPYEGNPLIHIAYKNQEYEIFKTLLLDTETDLKFITNILIIACREGNLDYVKLILEETKKQNRAIDINIHNGIILHNACLSGNDELVKYLLSLEGVKLDLKNYEGDSFFISACKNKKKDCKCAKLLFDEYKKRNIKFDINEENDVNKTAIYYACEKKNIDLVNYLLSISDIDNIKNFNFFPIACSSGNIKIVQLLYNRFYDKIDESIITDSFSIAVNSRNINLVKYLLKIQDIKNKIIFNNETLIDCFITTFMGSNFEMAELLHNEFGDKIDINTESCGYTPLYINCKEGNIEMVNFLLSKKWKKNIDINTVIVINEEEKTPFVIACENGYSDIAKILYDNKPNFDEEKNIALLNKLNSCNEQTRTFREFKNPKIVDTVFNINDANKSKPLYNIEYNNRTYEYPRTINYFIEDKTFTAIIDENKNIKFDFKGLEEITSEQFEKEINEILNSFENVNDFDTYLSWLPLALIQFKKEKKEKIRNKNGKQNSNDKIEFLDIHGNSNKVKDIINNLKDDKNKILICDFSFSSEELKEDINDVKDEEFRKKYSNSGHAAPLVIFNSKDEKGNPKIKILAFNTGFSSKKAFKKFKKESGNNVEIIKINKDLYQKHGSCNVSPKPMIEALFSSFLNELKEDESLVDKLEQYSKDMKIANKLSKLRNEQSILSKVKNMLFDTLSKLNLLELAKNIKNSAEEYFNTKDTISENKDTENTKNLMNAEKIENKKKSESKEEFLRNIEDKKLEEYLERLEKYKKINEKLAKNYKKLYANYNENLDKIIKDVNKTIKKKDFEKNPMDYLH